MKKRIFGILAACALAFAAQGQKCDSLYSVSLSLFDSKDYQGSLDVVNEVLGVCPLRSDYYVHRSKCYKELKNYVAELHSLDAAISIDSNCVEAWTEKALWEVEFEKYQSAIRSHIKVLSLLYSGDSTKVFFEANLGALYVLTNQNEKAFDMLQPLCHKDSTNISLLTNLSASAIYLNRFPEAEWALEKILAQMPQSIEALINMGLCKSEQGEYESAIIYFDKVLNSNPDDAYALNNAGWAYLKLGKIQTSLDYINKSIQLNPSNSYAYRNKAYALQAKGASAKEICKTVKLALDNGFTDMYGDEMLRMQQEYCK